MGAILLISSGFLLVNVLVGLIRIIVGPTPADRMLAAQLLGTTGVAVLLLLAEAMGREVAAMAAARDVALVLATLAAVAVVAFVRRTWPAGPARRAGSAPFRVEGKGVGGADA